MLHSKTFERELSYSSHNSSVTRLSAAPPGGTLFLKIFRNSASAIQLQQVFLGGAQ